MNSSDTPGRKKRAPLPPMPAGQQKFLWGSGFLAIFLLIAPSYYVIKYNAVDRPLENKIASRYLTPAHLAANDQTVTVLATPDPNNVTLQTSAALESPSADLRRNAVIGMSTWIKRRWSSFQRPMDAINVKTALAHVAGHDPDPTVRKAAGDALQEIASQGAVISR